MEKEALITLIREKTTQKDGKEYLACEDALILAEKHGVKPGQIGKACNEEKIKIKHCQLGCF
ncbi:MAG: hypothetical protein KKA07_17520 [Bacteroidetes bacterium]|nr:hypothetical protein [Bacteroidota bacterium]MBU1720870.1 hypothetical protein [Bacteroidota bacterium]